MRSPWSSSTSHKQFQEPLLSAQTYQCTVLTGNSEMTPAPDHEVNNLPVPNNLHLDDLKNIFPSHDVADLISTLFTCNNDIQAAVEEVIKREDQKQIEKDEALAKQLSADR